MITDTSPQGEIHAQPEGLDKTKETNTQTEISLKLHARKLRIDSSHGETI